MPRRTSALAALLFADASLVEALHTRSAAVSFLEQFSFDQFVTDYNRQYASGSDEWKKRENIFNQRKEQVLHFMTGPESTWSQGINRFMDYSDAEYRGMLGYTGSASRTSGKSGAVSLFRRRRTAELPHSVILLSDQNKTLAPLVRDQGMCGSCWAEAATAVLEGHLETYPEVLKRAKSAEAIPTLSSQTMVSCTNNDRHCGGTGGCQGATVELGYEMVKARGMPLARAWPYTSGSGGTPECRQDVFSGPQVRVGITGYTVLPTNKADPLKEALTDTNAPIAVSVDATNWMFYNGGIFSDTFPGHAGDFQVNHAVTLVGYTNPTDGAGGFWVVKNSWGEYWGERGFIRVEMKENEDEHCGTDTNTHEGLACDGDPNTAWVCGTSGILYDSVYPTGLYLMEETETAAAEPAKSETAS